MQTRAAGKLIIVCGLPGAGKTTYARDLIGRDGGLRFCPDDWIRALGLDIRDENRRSKIEALHWQQARGLLRDGGTAVIEWRTWGRSERDVLRNEARALGALVELHYLSAPIDVLYDRIQRRGLENPAVTRPDLARWAHIFQAPTPQELALFDKAVVIEHSPEVRAPNSEAGGAAEFAMRRFEPSDRDAIQSIRQRAFVPIFDSFRRLLGDEIFQREYSDAHESQAAYLDSICQDGSGKEVYVLVVSGRVVGFVGLSADVDRRRGEIDLNAVAPDYQGRGAGKFMYAFALNRLKALGVTVVRVSTGNDASHGPARRAYEGAGFSASIPTVTMYRLV